MRIIFFLLIGFTAFSQHSLRYKKFASQLVPIDTIKVELKYKSGKIKERSTKLKYKHKGEFFEFYYGNRTLYRRNGQISRINEFDPFGITTKSKCFIKGTVWCESETLEIDTNAKNQYEFLKLYKHLNILTNVKIYAPSIRAGSMYLKKEGKKRNNKKIGIWKKYSYLDKLIKEKNYNKVRN